MGSWGMKDKPKRRRERKQSRSPNLDRTHRIKERQKVLYQRKKERKERKKERKKENKKKEKKKEDSDRNT